MSQPFEFTDSAGRKPIKPREVKPCGGGLLDLVVANLRPNNGDAVRSPQNNRNENSNDALDLTAGKKIDPRNPNNPKPCSDPWITIVKMVNNQLPNRFNPNPSVASSKPADEQFSVPVYVFQNPEDNTITVYNLYGEGGVTTCTIVPEERKLSIADATELIDQLLAAGNNGSTELNNTIPDMNEDGKLNINDVTALIDMLLQSAE